MWLGGDWWYAPSLIRLDVHSADFVAVDPSQWGLQVNFSCKPPEGVTSRFPGSPQAIMWCRKPPPGEIKKKPTLNVVLGLIYCKASSVRCWKLNIFPNLRLWRAWARTACELNTHPSFCLCFLRFFSSFFFFFFSPLPLCMQVLGMLWKGAGAEQERNSSRISRCSAGSGPILGAFSWTTSVKKIGYGRERGALLIFSFKKKLSTI